MDIGQQIIGVKIGVYAVDRHNMPDQLIKVITSGSTFQAVLQCAVQFAQIRTDVLHGFKGNRSEHPRKALEKALEIKHTAAAEYQRNHKAQCHDSQKDPFHSLSPCFFFISISHFLPLRNHNRRAEPFQHACFLYFDRKV